MFIECDTKEVIELSENINTGFEWINEAVNISLCTSIRKNMEWEGVGRRYTITFFFGKNSSIWYFCSKEDRDKQYKKLIDKYVA